jgi:hypothetical protein
MEFHQQQKLINLDDVGFKVLNLKKDKVIYRKADRY